MEMTSCTLPVMPMTHHQDLLIEEREQHKTAIMWQTETLTCQEKNLGKQMPLSQIKLDDSVFDSPLGGYTHKDTP